jgi:hypothetical protein
MADAALRILCRTRQTHTTFRGEGTSRGERRRRRKRTAGPVGSARSHLPGPPKSITRDVIRVSSFLITIPSRRSLTHDGCTALVSLPCIEIYTRDEAASVRPPRPEKGSRAPVPEVFAPPLGVFSRPSISALASRFQSYRPSAPVPDARSRRASPRAQGRASRPPTVRQAPSCMRARPRPCPCRGARRRPAHVRTGARSPGPARAPTGTRRRLGGG